MASARHTADSTVTGCLVLINQYWENQGVREKARVFETLNFFGKGLTQIETDVQLL